MLDLVRVAEQLPALVARLSEERARARERLRAALATLAEQAAYPGAWRARLTDAETRWPLALPLEERIDIGYAPPPAPPVYVALGVDGSHIDVDRHAAAPCYVLNLGWARIAYGIDDPPELAGDAELQPSSSGLVERDEADAQP